MILTGGNKPRPYERCLKFDVGEGFMPSRILTIGDMHESFCVDNYHGRAVAGCGYR